MKLKSLGTIWIVILSVVITLIVAVLIVGAWFGYKYMKDGVNKLESDSETKVQTQVTKKTTTPKTTAPNESPIKSAENFLKAIFDTFPGSSVNLAKAKTYLSGSLKSQVKDTKESYWDLHGYIHSGPCSVSTSEISKTDTTAIIEITTEWGEECMGMAEPYYRYKMSVSNGKWVIDEIEQLQDSGYSVPRDF